MRNIEWNNLEVNDEVEERKTYFVAHREGVPYAVICWSGTDAKIAQTTLLQKSFAFCSDMLCRNRVRRYGELCEDHK